MKIYNKSDFIMGVSCLCAIPLFVLHIIDVDWWQYFITIAISLAFIYRGLSEKAGERNRIISENFNATARILYGRFHVIKTNLPWMMALAFFSIAFILRFAFRIWLPIWVHLIFVIGLAASTFYSIGMINSIKADIDQNIIKEDHGTSERNL